MPTKMASCVSDRKPTSKKDLSAFYTVPERKHDFSSLYPGILYPQDAATRIKLQKLTQEYANIGQQYVAALDAKNETLASEIFARLAPIRVEIKSMLDCHPDAKKEIFQRERVPSGRAACSAKSTTVCSVDSDDESDLTPENNMPEVD